MTSEGLFSFHGQANLVHTKPLASCKQSAKAFIGASEHCFLQKNP
jgi:hypothetical protein